MNKQRFSSLPPEALTSSSKALRIPRHNESGSETDASGSTETLSAEERHTLKHTQRQEPQGEEQVLPLTPTSASGGSNSSLLSRRSPTASSIISLASQNDSNLSIGSSSNTLIIHHSVPDEPWSNRLLSNYLMSNSRKTSQERPLANVESLATESSQRHTHLPEMTVTPTSSQSSTNSLYLTSSLANTMALDLPINSTVGLPKTSYNTDKKMSYPLNTSSNITNKYVTSTVLNDIPSSYLDQSEVLKHLIAKDDKDFTKVSVGASSVSTSGAYSDQSNSSSNSGINLLINEGSSGGAPSTSKQLSLDKEDLDISALINKHSLHSHPPPSYRHWQLENSSNEGSELKDTNIVDLRHQSMEKSSFSRSQPDLSHVGSTNDSTSTKDILTRLGTSTLDDDDPVSIKEMNEILTRENATLKLEVDLYHRKVTKLQKFELEMTKVEEQHEALVKLCERREQLERLARHKLHAELRRVTDLNTELKERVEILSNQLTSRSSSVTEDANSSDSSALKRELNKRDVLIAQLMSQNKELVAAKERQEIELTAQRQTLNEQRAHIDILDSALTNAQTNVVKLEEEVRKKQSLVEQAAQFKRLLLNMQLASDRREQSEKNLRQKLENELYQLRSNALLDQTNSDVAELKKDLREKEEKILQLESEIQKWEQRFLQESALRQNAAETTTALKEAKVSSGLERSMQDNERRMAQAKSEKLRHLDEMHNLSKKITDVESRNRSLESRLAEREAMIRALQKRVEEKEGGPSKAFQKGHPPPQPTPASRR